MDHPMVVLSIEGGRELRDRCYDVGGASGFTLARTLFVYLNPETSNAQ